MVRSSARADRAQQLRLIHLVVAAQKRRHAVPRVRLSRRAALQRHVRHALDVATPAKS